MATDTVLESLKAMRDEHIRHANANYHRVLEPIMDKAIADFEERVEGFKEEMREQVRTRPECMGTSVSFQINLEDLFGETAGIEVWIYETYEYQQPRCLRFPCKRRMCDTEYRIFEQYFTQDDPHVKRLWDAIKEAFPHARIDHRLQITFHLPAALHLTIRYDLGKFPLALMMGTQRLTSF